MVRADTIRATFTRVCGVHRRVTSNEPVGPALARSAPVTFQPLAEPVDQHGLTEAPGAIQMAVQPPLML